MNGGCDCAGLLTAEGCIPTCTNSIGSFNCSCNEGYILSNDGFTCLGMDS